MRNIARFLSFAILLLISSNTLFAQAQGFYDVRTTNGSIVWAAGNGGAILRSLDGGATWARFVVGTQAIRTIFPIENVIWAAGDSGKVYHSTNFGSTWQVAVVGSPSNKFTSSYFFDANSGLIVGSGIIYKTIDGGLTWESKTPDALGDFTAIDFTNPDNGFIVGKNGIVQRTNNGGNNWQSLTIREFENANILSVSVKGSKVYLVGEDGFAYKSVNGGESWSALNFKTDSRSDVTGVFIQSADTTFFIGGGGYIRRTTNQDASYIWGEHELYAPLSHLYFYNHLQGWAVSDKNNVVLRTTNGGETWQLPTGTTISTSWLEKRVGSFIGNTLTLAPYNKRTVFAAGGSTVIKSQDLGETWTQIATIPSASSVHSFYVSHTDSNTWIAAVGRARVVKTTNAGQTWTTTITKTYTNYGMPLELDPDKPNVVYYAPEAEGNPSNANAVFYRSTDFGSTWDSVSTTQFRSPCDIQIVRGDSSNILYCGDGVTGSGQARMWRSTDEGKTWTSIFTGIGSEMPMISNGSLAPEIGYVTQWSSGGVQKSTNYGRTWTTISNVSSAWGVDIAKDDPNVMIFGVYGGGNSYLSYNSGSSFRQGALSGANSGFLFVDRATLIAKQTSRIFKFSATYTVPINNSQSLAISSPSPGETLNFGTVKNIVWASSNLPVVRIEFQENSNGNWQVITDSILGGVGSYSWQVPPIPTSDARIRISNRNDSSLTSISGAFTIRVALSSLDKDSIGLFANGAPAFDTITITNSGNGTLVVSDVFSTISDIRVSRRVFSIPAQSSDTLTIGFFPPSLVSASDSLFIISNAPNSPQFVKVTVNGSLSAGEQHVQSKPQSFLLEQNYPNPFNPSTIISYQLASASDVQLKVFDVLGREITSLVSQRQAAGRYSITFNAKNLTSGTYFYRLNAGEYSSIKKMLFIK